MSIFDIFKKTAKNNLFSTVKSLEKNSILIKIDENKKITNPAISKFGGKPYLPADFVWPQFTCAEDGIERPLSFFCQINMEDVKAYDRENILPKSGMLYFFYECESFTWGFDPKDAGAARVFWYDLTEDFKPLDPPTEVSEEYLIPEIAISFKAVKSYPKFEEFVALTGVECDFEDYDKCLEKLGVDIDADPEEHKLLGYADLIQDEMLTQCERVSRGLSCGDPESYSETPPSLTVEINKCAPQWTMLLQLSTVSAGDFEYMFGDCGMLYFFIKKTDLLDKRFDRALFAVQCG